MILDDLIPRDAPIDNDTLLGRFLEYVENRQLILYPAQEQAILELYEGKNVILNTPTGSGKSLVAAALHFQAFAQGRRSIYTCPIKALVNEKWMALCREFGPDNVGLSTGDATVNRHAPILCCTAEILANMALRQGGETEVDDVVMDEFHWYADRDRGVAWQAPLLTLPQTRFLLMSATLGKTEFFEEKLYELTGRPSVTVDSNVRPVPLEFTYSELQLAQTLEKLIAEDKAPVYVVHFTQLEAAQNAQSFTSIKLCTREQKEAIADKLAGVRFTSPYGPEIRKWLRHGIGIHHAGLLPRYRVLVEQLAQQGLLKIICGTDTLGVGINVPIRTVLFTRLWKFDGKQSAILSARDFHQISGRAGRKGFDDQGWVVAQAPEHVVDNLKQQEKAARSGKKKVVNRKPPSRNFVPWDARTFRRLIAAPPERLTSQFKVTHGMLLNVLSRPGDGCRAMRDVIRGCHDSSGQKKAHARRAWQLFRGLLERGIVQFVEPSGEPLPAGLASAAGKRKLRVNVELQDDFSMDQTLSLYLLDTIQLVDPEDPEYALVVLTLVESILEDPDIILRKQLDRIKGRAVAEMKMQGIDYEQRMEELEKLEYPKPHREFIYDTFNTFADQHPWVGQENIRPKSIVREMFESFSSFADYIRDYELQRSEGLLLRHLHSTYKTLAQTVPDAAKDEVLRELEIYLETMIRQVDSSLLDEWEKMRDPSFQGVEPEEVRPAGSEAAELDITRDPQTFTAAIRTRLFALLRALANGNGEEAVDSLETPDDGEGQPWTAERFTQLREAYLSEHQRLCLDPNARNLRHTYVHPAEDGQRWTVQQMLVDPEEHNDWAAQFEVDLLQSRQQGKPVLRLDWIGPFDELLRK